MAGLWCVHHKQRFLVLVLLLISVVNHSIAIEEFLRTCGESIDLINDERIHSGVLKVNMPEDFRPYQGKFTQERNCDININFESGLSLQIELYYLDIMPLSSDTSRCSTGLLVLEQNRREVYGGRLCEEGWKWEKQHREKKQEKRVINSTPLTFRLESDGPFRGKGFKVHFNKFRPTLPCNSHKEFRCERLQRCVFDDVTCDGWDDCGDNSDEEEDAGCELFTVSEIFAIIIGVLLVIGTVAVTVVFLIKYRRIIHLHRLQRKESKLVLEEERRSMREPSLVFPHRANSMESVNKSHYSRRMDVESLMDRMELDKADKYSCRDNMSERSYKSVNRRNKMASQSSMAREKAAVVGSSRQELDKDLADRNGEKRERGRSGREDDRDSEKMSKEKKYTDDDDDYDSEEERRRRRRRRSRDRRRYDRSDDEDYDSDYDRKRRSRYDSEDENDSDQDRRRRRRRRYDDSDEDYDSDRESRRRRRSRRRYDSEDDSDSERKRSSRKNLDGEDEDDKESSRRRRRSRDRRRYDSDDDYDSDRDRRRRRRDSDEYDSDRDRRRRRSRDRRSRDLSEEKIDKDQVKPVQASPEKSESQELNARQPVPENPKQPRRDDPISNSDRRNPYPYQESGSKKDRPVERPLDNFSPPPVYNQVEKAPKQEVSNISPSPVYKQVEKPPKQEVNTFSPPPVEQDRPKYSRRTPRSNGVAPTAAGKESDGNAWVPRSERKRNRRSRGDLPQNDDGDVYEDVVPKIHLENLGFREESV